MLSPDAHNTHTHHVFLCTRNNQRQRDPVLYPLHSLTLQCQHSNLTSEPLNHFSIPFNMSLYRVTGVPMYRCTYVCMYVRGMYVLCVVTGVPMYACMYMVCMYYMYVCILEEIRKVQLNNADGKQHNTTTPETTHFLFFKKNKLPHWDSNPRFSASQASFYKLSY